MTKVLTIVGTRPEIIRVSALEKCKKNSKGLYINKCDEKR